MTRCTLHGFVGAVLLLGRRNILVPTNFASQSHAFPADEVGHRVVEAVGFDGIPCSKEDNIAHEDLVFECGSEVTFWFAEGFLDLAPNSGDGFDGCAFKFGDFDCGGEHVFDESCILEDFVWRSGKLELLDNLSRFVDVQNRSSCSDSETRVL